MYQIFVTLVDIDLSPTYWIKIQTEVFEEKRAIT